MKEKSICILFISSKGKVRTHNNSAHLPFFDIDQSTLGAFASKFNSTADGGVAELDPFEGLGGRNPVDISGGFGGESFQNDSTDYLSEGLIPTTQVSQIDNCGY